MEETWRRSGYVRIGSVRVRVRPESGSVAGGGDGCCGPGHQGGGWCGLPVPTVLAKNRAASCFKTPTRKGASALDRLPRLPLGGTPAPCPPRKRSSATRQEKTDKLKELTEKLKDSPTKPPQTQPPPTVDFDINLDLPKAESRAIVGAYIQRTIPFRSASFSQVDFSSSDGKYNIRPTRSQTPTKPSVSLSLPRKKISEGSNVSPVNFEQLPVASANCVQNEVKTGVRALTHPLGRDFEKFPGKIGDLNDKIVEANSSAPAVGKLTTQSCPTSPDQLHPRGRSVAPSAIPKAGLRKQLSDSIEEECLEVSKVTGDSVKCQCGDSGRSELWASSAEEEPQTPEDVPAPTWPERRPKLIYQSSEEREDDAKCRKVVLSRANSLSEGESDNGYNSNRGDTPSRGSPSLFDLSDSEGKPVLKGHPPRSYSKRPLRGPYGQMLEAEMKKPEARKLAIQQEELKFLSTRDNSRLRSMDDSQLTQKRSHDFGRSLLPSVKRKVSANLGYSASEEKSEKPEVHHQRTTSSPSQLEGCSSRMGNPARLLGSLLKGSSERTLAEANPAHLLINSPAYWKDTRTHVVVELYETEKSYVESLQILVMKYLQPLKNPETTCLTDSALVDEIFHKVPEILAHHELFLEELRKRLENWDINQKIGDVLLDTFTRQSVIETYSAFINNWENAYETIKTSIQSKPAFARFVESTAKEHKGKLSLDSLLIMPVQRIPRYELLIQTLLKHTEPCHSDATLLLEAQQGIHELATTINLGQHATLNTRSSTCHELAQLESIIEGLAGGLTSPDRTFLCHDQVSITTTMGRKDRALFLFSDLLIIASMKRRSGTIRKIPQNVPGSLMHALEGNRFKLLMKIPLDDLEIVKDDNVRKMLKEMEQLNADVSTLSQMAELVTTLHCPHSQLEENVREMLGALNNQLTERHAADSQLSYLELNINTPSGMENIALIFSKPEKRTLWEETFNDAKQRLALSGHQRALPELMSAVPIRKTRAGLQFTCAAPTYGPGLRDVWVCNSDGYVGQVCVLSLHPEPTVTSCNGVCNARILCIAPVPGPSNDASSLIVNSGISISVEDADKMVSNIQLDSSSSSDDESRDDEMEGDSSEEAGAGTMWLGTEDGCIHVYNCTDNIRTKKNKIKIQHNAPVHSIIYLDNRVYVALANGDLSVYSREPSGSWNTNDAVTVTVGSAAAPVTKIVPITSQLWCTCHTAVKILNTTSLEIENSFTVCDSNRAITSMANSGYSVWISLQNSSSIRLFNAVTFESLGEVNIAPAVTKMLASSDDIIRQHKSACLRVTSLLACKDLLWIGTSAGVILTMPLPHILPNSVKLTNTLNVAGVPHGHTGHVRFLTTVDLSLNSVDPKRKAGFYTKRKLPKLLVISGGDGYEDFRSAGVAEMAGREDSTNHLLLWHV
ncbi:hypothetical protein GE061_013223 [Apolygus lucorum]|uniref:DH domain-containing protein n=1 Tax=Apolygus lucorum TaxID=248454 RepID=A0A8S9XUU4_APOLU|nr:hypothetical protein GE061_013223 [Apolygus lucorum]